MINFQQKPFQRHAKKAASITERKKKKLTKMIPEKAQALNLIDKGFKSTILNMLKSQYGISVKIQNLRE